MSRRLIAALVLSPLAFMAMPAAAQDTAGEKVNQLIVYGDDPCPAPSSPDEITVCARKEEAERFRIPEALRQSASPQNDAWNNRVLAYETVTRRGILSCSPAGAGGELGCTQKLINAAYAEKRGDETVRFSELIAQERARRLSTIDADAAETQSRVEEFERQYEERARREAEATSQPAPAAAPAGNLSAPPQD
ncbi:MAG: hypothetical protein RIQ46_2028 [Pseudomonadota bacterium]|jgi:hypothetical protein